MITPFSCHTHAILMPMILPYSCCPPAAHQRDDQLMRRDGFYSTQCNDGESRVADGLSALLRHFVFGRPFATAGSTAFAFRSAEAAFSTERCQAAKLFIYEVVGLPLLRNTMPRGPHRHTPATCHLASIGAHLQASPVGVICRFDWVGYTL